MSHRFPGDETNFICCVGVGTTGQDVADLERMSPEKRRKNERTEVRPLGWTDVCLILCNGMESAFYRIQSDGRET